MRRRRSFWKLFFGALVLLAAGVLFGRYVVPSSTSPSGSSLSSLPRVYSFGCAGEAPPTIDPASIPVACADGSAVLTHLTWGSWTGSKASGRGILELNDCTPTCAGGTFSPYAASVTLSDPMASRTQGQVFALWRSVRKTGRAGHSR